MIHSRFEISSSPFHAEDNTLPETKVRLTSYLSFIPTVLFACKLLYRSFETLTFFLHFRFLPNPPSPRLQVLYPFRGQNNNVNNLPLKLINRLKLGSTTTAILPKPNFSSTAPGFNLISVPTVALGSSSTRQY